MKNKPDATSLNPRIRDLGSLSPEKPKIGNFRKAAFIGAAAISAVYGGVNIAKAFSSDRVVNPAAGNPQPAKPLETRAGGNQISDEIKEDSKKILAEYNAEAPTATLNEYKVQEGDSPAAIVEKSRNLDGQPVEDTATYLAQVDYIQQQIPEDGTLHPNDQIKLAPGYDIPGHTVQLAPEQPPTLPDY